MAEVVFRYVAEQNPHEGYLPGVPLRDLSAADIAALPAWLQSSIAAQPFYVAVEPAKPKRQPAQEKDNG